MTFLAFGTAWKPFPFGGGPLFASFDELVEMVIVSAVIFPFPLPLLPLLQFPPLSNFLLLIFTSEEVNQALPYAPVELFGVPSKPSELHHLLQVTDRYLTDPEMRELLQLQLVECLSVRVDFSRARFHRDEPPMGPVTMGIREDGNCSFVTRFRGKFQRLEEAVGGQLSSLALALGFLHLLPDVTDFENEVEVQRRQLFNRVEAARPTHADPVVGGSRLQSEQGTIIPITHVIYHGFMEDA